MRNFIIPLIILLATACAISAAGGEEPTGYLTVTGPCNLEFPKDHGAHPGYRTEWWYYTGNLHAVSGERLGFQLTFFRSQISPPDDRLKWPRPASGWRTQQVYLAHSAVSNITQKQHLQAESASREALNMAGVRQTDHTTAIVLKNWSAHISPDRHLLNVQTAGFAFELVLTPQKPPVLHGKAGYSLKGSTADRASCYYSFTRLDTRGKLSIGENVFGVKGWAWMDHEFSTAPLEPGLQGWDWFSLQLSDQTELMAFVLRNDQGKAGTASSATLIDKQGQSRHIGRDEFELSVRDTWKSPRSGAKYPAEWRLVILPDLLDITIKSNLSDQEMRTSETTGVIYWEGSVSAAGTKEGRPVSGAGYVELTGYAIPFEAPM
jgi:predicted secreted hydrolase